MVRKINTGSYYEQHVEDDVKDEQYIEYLVSRYECEYDANGNKICERRYDSNGNLDRWCEYEYDAMGNVTIWISYDETGSEKGREYYAYEYVLIE